MKDVGIVGLPEADVGTVFTALTAIEGASPGSSTQAVVPVPDERVDRLAELHDSKKRVYTQLRFVDSSGAVRRGARAGAGRLSAELIGHLRTVDALLLVVRGTRDADPVGELGELQLELIYADLEPVAGKLARDRKAAQDPQAKRALETLASAQEMLEAGEALRTGSWDEVDHAVFQGMGLVTMKPFVVVAVVDEGSVGDAPPGMIPVAAALEAEVAGMDEADAAELLAGFGLTERALPAVIRAVYEQLDLITFLTAGDKESRAWEVARGATAPQAAGVIHSDFERGFIRAEVISYGDLDDLGSEAAARDAGRLRSEGKEYVVADGDVIHFRFNV